MFELPIPTPQQLSDLYQNEGIVRLSRFLSKDMLSQILNEISHGEELANQDLLDQWNGKKLTFYS